MARGGFPGIPGGNMQQLMRQAQKMQQQMMKAQEEIVAAVNDALKKGEETRESEMSKIGGAGMGGMF